MKKLFTIDDFLVAFISALGYGYGYSVTKHFGWSEVMCVVASFAFGILLEEVTGSIVFSKAVQEKRKNRVMAFAAIMIIFLIGQYVSVRWLGESMIENVQEEFIYVIGIPIIGFIVSLLIRAYHIRKIRELYGDGSEGFLFDLAKEDIEETNRENRKISGEYDADLAVKTRTGIFVGKEYGSGIAYFGIPYAKPPVGKLRWKAPEPLPASEDVFEAGNFGASPIQVEHKGSILKNHRQSEDCLTLNVDVGGSKEEKKKAVLVLFHHGDFAYGSSADPMQYGREFIEKHEDIIFVSFNYRLGIFGFIDFSEVPGGEAYPDAINLGLLDQIAALKWVKENIAAFGGDPRRITVIGFDAGATSICLLAASEQAKGLFQRAFIFNGNLDIVYDTAENPRAMAKELLKETHTASMEQLLCLDTETLKAAAQKLWHYMCAPAFDERLFPHDMLRAYQEGKASGIEFIIGVTSRETQVWRSILGDDNYEKMISSALDDMRRKIDAPTAAAVQKYLESKMAAVSGMEARSKLAEQWNALGVYRGALKLSEGGNKVHLFYWDEKPLIEKLGSGAIDAATVLLGNSEALHMYGNVMDNDISEILQSFLHKFISGAALRLYQNEIKGVDALKWKTFPKALIVSDKIISFAAIEDRITEVKELLDFIKK